MDRSYEDLTQRAAFVELAGRTLIAVTGSDRVQLLHSFTTNDIKRLTPGTGCEAFVTSPQGKTLGHVFVFCEPDRFILDTSPGQAQTLIAHFARYVITEEVEFADLTPLRRVILIAGAKAAECITRLSGATAPEAMLTHASATIAGHEVMIRRVPYTGRDSFFLEMAADDVGAVSTLLTAEGITAGHSAAVEAARLEAGFPLFGLDITEDNLPQEVARDRHAISFTKGCYLGQETVARIDAIGHVNRLLCGLKLSGTCIPAAGAALLAGGQATGHVTSATWSPRLNVPLVLAYVRRQHTKPGGLLAVGEARAELLSLPLPGEPENSA